MRQTKKIIFVVVFLLSAYPLRMVAQASEPDSIGSKGGKVWNRIKRGLTIGGYGEAVGTRYFYSDDYTRYAQPQKFRHTKSRGEVDLPHVTLMLGYDFGHGWRVGTELEYEHGGNGSTLETENKEGGEIETEVKRGGEVELEQFWLEKTFFPWLNVRAGHIIVPVGALNNHHEPDKYFTVTRPEEEYTMLPSTWHQTGLSVWGKYGKWRYEVQFIQGLEADHFSDEKWIHSGAKSAFEFGRSTQYAGAVRIDNFSVPGLRLSVSGYLGGSAQNTIKKDRYGKAKGRVMIGSFDFLYDNHNFIVRGVIDYGHLSDADVISRANKNYPKGSGCPRTNVASGALAASLEAGYDVLSLWHRQKSRQQLYVFGHYGFYNTMLSTTNGIPQEPYYKRHIFAAGINYRPIPQITIKAEYKNRLLDKVFHSAYNKEQSISLGITYIGLFDLGHRQSDNILHKTVDQAEDNRQQIERLNEMIRRQQQEIDELKSKIQ